MRLRLHPQVARDTRGVLAYTLERFGEGQMLAYKQLISEAKDRLTERPTAGIRRDDIGHGVRVLSIARRGRRASHGFIYRVVDDEVIEVLRFVHLVRFLPALLPDDA